MSARTVLFRITHERYASDPFSGEGGLRYGSRWASKGRRVSYAADHLATATLEKIAGVQRADLLAEMVFIRAEIGSSHVETLDRSTLPDDWDRLPAPDTTRTLGDNWLAAADQSPLLEVPSVVLPHSRNYVVNAEHPAASDLEITETTPLLLDNRVLCQLGASLL
jgi:RES domain-containing protein